MTLPSILLGVVLSSLYGAAFHLLRGGSLVRLILYIVLSWVGFWTGHVFAEMMGWSFVRVGALNAGDALDIEFRDGHTPALVTSEGAVSASPAQKPAPKPKKPKPGPAKSGQGSLF